VTKGNLPPELREVLALTWSWCEQKLYVLFFSVHDPVSPVLPPFIRKAHARLTCATSLGACARATGSSDRVIWAGHLCPGHAGGMDETRATLTAKLAEIDEQMATMEKKPVDQGSISFGKRIGEGTSMAVDRLAQVAVHDRLQVTRADVVRALEKLDEGSYGVCDVCGEPIAAGRLEALPWAVLCVEDAARR
jgi:DnaK suppressor protein